MGEERERREKDEVMGRGERYGRGRCGEKRMFREETYVGEERERKGEE